ncbi:hypothetical protein KC345_g3802 [Hortaea werneckii]|nr:hypothetical protein KC345_g3802 [Hortaea werneckii]
MSSNVPPPATPAADTVINDFYNREDYVRRRAHFLGRHDAYKNVSVFPIARGDAGLLEVRRLQTLGDHVIRDGVVDGTRCSGQLRDHARTVLAEQHLVVSAVEDEELDELLVSLPETEDTPDVLGDDVEVDDVEDEDVVAALLKIDGLDGGAGRGEDDQDIEVIGVVELLDDVRAVLGGHTGTDPGTGDAERVHGRLKGEDVTGPIGVGHCQTGLTTSGNAPTKPSSTPYI